MKISGLVAFVFWLQILMWVGCNKREIVLTKDEQQFSNVIIDVYLANAAANLIQEGNKDSARTQLVMRALNIHEMDTSDFNDKLSALENNPPRMKVLFDTVLVRLERMRND